MGLSALFAAMLLLAAACAQAVTPTASPLPVVVPSSTEEDEGTVPSGPPPRLDTAIASVPLEAIVFDTFRGGFIRLSRASDEDIEGLRDQIKPVYEPRYDPVEGGQWLNDKDLVLGYVSARRDAYSYPIKMLNLHEIVNDVIDGVPLVVTYCPLCASGAVYSRELGERTLLFGNTSALYESDLVMYDHQTGSYWHQVIGEAIVGSLTGERLTLLPALTTTWGEWKRLYPDTKILSRNLGLFPATAASNLYDRDPFEGLADSINRKRFAFPVDEDKLDERLRPGDMVLAVQVGESHKVYLLTGKPDSVVNDEIDGEEVLVVFRTAAPSAAAYLRTVEGQTLTFAMDGGTLKDLETGTSWDDAGRAVSGPLRGNRLTPLSSRTGFWFSIAGALPAVTLHE